MNDQATAIVSTVRPATKSFAGTVLTLALGLVVQGLVTPIAASSEPSAASNLAKVSNATGTLAQKNQPLQDGVYLYGQSSTVEQLGSTYLVFEVKQSKVTGAFYMPRSFFDCFQGTLQADRLALNITNSYEKTVHPHSVALQTAATSAAAGSGVAPIGLAGYRQIKQLGAQDRRMLSTCKATFAGI